MIMMSNQFIRDEVSRLLKDANDQYQIKHNLFIAEATTSPLHAITWSEKLVEASSAMRVIQCASNKINEGEHYHLDGVLREFIRIETHNVMASLCENDSSSSMANAVHHAKQRGRAEAIADLNCIVPAIRASLQ
jgi:hypothetical protein